MNSSVMQFTENAWDAPDAEDGGSIWKETTYCSEDSARSKSSYQNKSQTPRRNNQNTNEKTYQMPQKSLYFSNDGGDRQNRRNRYSNNEQRSENTKWRNEHSDRYQNTGDRSTRNKYTANERREYNRTEQNSKNRYSNGERQNQEFGGQSNYSDRYSNNERRDYNRGSRQVWSNKSNNFGSAEKAAWATSEKTYSENTYESKEWTDYDSGKNFEQRSNDERSKSQDSDKVEIMVPVSCIGRIIGRQGSRIRSLEETSQARIKIQNANTCDQNNEVSVTIIGSESAREKAKELINEVVNQDYSSRPQQNTSSYSKETRQDSIYFKEPQKHEDNQDSGESGGTIDWQAVIAASMEERKKRWEGLPPIKKDFYFEDPEIARMSVDAVEAFRTEQNNITVQVLDEDDDRSFPNPVTKFVQAFRKYPGIIKEIDKQGFEQPSPIQCQAWPILLQGHDMIGIAQTGTGKTLAFLLPALIHIDSQVTPREERGGPSCLIFAPTRELAQQIERETNKYSYKGIKCVCVYGGGNRREQIQTVERGVEIVIATPGRLNDLVMNKFLDVSSVTYLVLDEADRMLDMGFEPQIKKVLLDIRPDRQTVMTSATWPEGVRRMASQYMTKPMLVFIGSLDIRAVHSVKQEVLFVDIDEKKPVLYDFINSMQPDDKVIVFVDKKIVADDLASDLLLNGIECQSIHGDREQCDREQAIEDLRTGFARILVATDVASRGLDIKDITRVHASPSSIGYYQPVRLTEKHLIKNHIFNFDFPRNIEEYVHRVGRTGRAGQSGSSITLMTRSDWSKSQPLIDIMEEAGQEVPQELYNMAERYKAWKDKKDAEDSCSRRGGRQGGRFNRRRQDDWI